MTDDLPLKFSADINEYALAQPHLFVLIIFLFSVALGLIIRSVFIRALSHYNRMKPSIVIKSFLSHLSNRTKIFFPLLVFLCVQPFIDFLDDTTALILHKVIQALVILSFGWVMIRLLGVIEDVAYERYSIERHDTYKSRRIRTQVQFIRRLLAVMIFILVVSAILITFKEVRNIGTTLLTSAGVAGIIVGIAAQKSIANLLAGIQIAFTQPIKLDDAVIVEGEWGNIEEITLTYVVVKIWDKRRIVLPIHYFIENPFQNWTRTSSELLAPIILYLDYTLPLDALREALDDILKDEKLWDQKVKVVQLVDTTEKCMKVRVLVSAVDAPTAWDLRCNIREKLITFIREHYPEALPSIRMQLTTEIPS